MDNQSSDPRPVAMWARVLAWAFVVVCAFDVVGGSIALLKGRPLLTIPWYQAVPFGLAIIWLAPLFWFVAITGRPPRYWPGVGTHLRRSPKH